jgi:glucokinase
VQASHALALDIGGSKIAGAIVARDGSLTALRLVPTPARSGPRAVLGAVVELARHVVVDAQARGVGLLGVGVGAAGHVDHDRGAITYASGILPGWAGTAVAAELSATLGLPVVVDNDVNAMALGEGRFGAGRPPARQSPAGEATDAGLGRYGDGLYVAVGTGVGGALILGGRLWRGATWTGGEIGHLLVDWDGWRLCSCGEPGHLEAYCAGPAIAARYAGLLAEAEGRSAGPGAPPPSPVAEEGHPDLTAETGAERPVPPDLRQVAGLARLGDPLARQAIAEGGHVLGLGLGGLLNVLDLPLLVIGGGVAELGDLWWPALEAALRANPMPGPARVALRPALLGTHAALAGAACLVFDDALAKERLL